MNFFALININYRIDVLDVAGYSIAKIFSKFACGVTFHPANVSLDIFVDYAIVTRLYPCLSAASR